MEHARAIAKYPGVGSAGTDLVSITSTVSSHRIRAWNIQASCGFVI
jgi:hypothetical protein